MIQVSNLTKRFPLRKETFLEKQSFITAVNNIDFEIPELRNVGIVGESGSGKSTIAKLLVKLIAPDYGTIHYKETNIHTISKKEEKAIRRDIQMVFQNPFASLDPRHTVYHILNEGLEVHHPHISKADRLKEMKHMLEKMHLPKNILEKFPHEFSGGERQRIAIARALIIKPKLLILDEPVSSLDVSIQAEIIKLLKEIQKNDQMTYLFISHDLHIVHNFCDYVYVMEKGHVVEGGETEDIFKNPKHGYTKTLINSIPSLKYY